MIARALNVTLIYGKSRNPVLHSLNLEIDSGQVLPILGGNGTGKTTLLKALSGLLRPHLGRILIDDSDLYQKRGVHCKGSRARSTPKDHFIIACQPAKISAISCRFVAFMAGLQCRQLTWLWTDSICLDCRIFHSCTYP